MARHHGRNGGRAATTAAERCLRHAALWRLRPSLVRSEAECHVPEELGVTTMDSCGLAGGEVVDCTKQCCREKRRNTARLAICFKRLATNRHGKAPMHT